MNPDVHDPWIHSECHIVCVADVRKVSSYYSIWIFTDCLWSLVTRLVIRVSKAVTWKPILKIQVCYLYIVFINFVSHLMTLEAAGSPPRNPIGPPSLIQDNSTERVGQFIVDLSDAAPQPRGREQITQTDIPTVAFLIKLEELNSHDVSFIWVVRKWLYITQQLHACYLCECEQHVVRRVS